MEGVVDRVTFVTLATLIFRSFLENGWKMWWIVSHLALTVAKIVVMYIHLIQICYTRLWEKCFGIPTKQSGPFGSYLFPESTVPFTSFYQGEVNVGTKVFTLNLNVGEERVTIRKNAVNKALRFFFAFTFKEKMDFFVNTMQELSFFNTCTLQRSEGAFHIEVENIRFTFESKPGRRCGSGDLKPRKKRKKA